MSELSSDGSSAAEDPVDSEEETELFRVHEADLQTYLSRMRVDKLFEELVEELLVEAPQNPVKFIVDYLFLRYPDQVKDSSFAKTFSQSTGGGIPLTGIESSFASQVEEEDGQELTAKRSKERVPLKISSKDVDEDCEDDNGSSSEDEGKKEKTETKGSTWNGKRRHALQPCHAREVEASGSMLDADDEASLNTYMENNLVFRQLEPFRKRRVVKAFKKETIRSPETEVIRQGSAAEWFYFVHEGVCESFVDSKRITVHRKGNAFGELALVSGGKNRTSVRVQQEPVTLLKISRSAYEIAMREAESSFQETVSMYLENIPFFAKTLSLEERMKLAFDVMEEESFVKGDILVKQHAPSDKFFLILTGSVVCMQRTSVEAPPQVVTTFEQGDWFGEVALITDRPRAASVSVESPTCTCLTIERSRFVRVFGPLNDILRRDSLLFKRFVTDKI